MANISFCVRQLSVNAGVIQRMVEGCVEEEARWKPSPDIWSVLEVINHLADEEREDFRARLQHLLSGATDPWPPIAPFQWADERRYNDRDLAPSLAAFVRERLISLDWLSRLGTMDWDTAYRHPPLDGLRAGDLLVSWVSHDVFHLRRLVELKWAYSGAQFGPYRREYAGDW